MGESEEMKEMLKHLYEQGKGEVRVGGAPLSRECEEDLQEACLWGLCVCVCLCVHAAAMDLGSQGRG